MIFNIISLAFTLFILMDPFGNVPLFISILKDIEAKRRRKIIIRELLIALGVIISFYFIGDIILKFLQVEQYSVQISGGIVLFIIALKMIFPNFDETKKIKNPEKEPFIVPLAIPFVAGPAVLAAVILYAHQQIPSRVIVPAIILAWLASVLILEASSFLQRLLGEKGIAASERLMGLILTLISVQMFLKGITDYVAHCHVP